MKIIEILSFNKELLVKLNKVGVKTEDCVYVEMYEDYCKLMAKGNKKSYTVLMLAEKFGISERKVYGVLKRLETTV